MFLEFLDDLCSLIVPTRKQYRERETHPADFAILSDVLLERLSVIAISVFVFVYLDAEQFAERLLHRKARILDDEVAQDVEMLLGERNLDARKRRLQFLRGFLSILLVFGSLRFPCFPFLRCRLVMAAGSRVLPVLPSQVTFETVSAIHNLEN
jgi:hypothetical protein